MFVYDDSIERVELEPHEYTEHSARAALERRRAKGEHWVMRHLNGKWYLGRVIS
jgi:hypothetical protein